MKKIIALLMLIALLFALAGCSNAVKEAEEAIASITAATTSKERKTAVSHAEELFDALDDKQKERVANSGTLYIALAERAIDDIGYVSDSPLAALNISSKINKAKEAYSKVSEQDKKLVTNADELTNASELLSKAETNREDAQDFAEKLFTGCAKWFRNAEFITIKNAWCAAPGVSYYFTFEFEIKNNYGITETVYYGTKSSVMDLSDENLSHAIQSFELGRDWYFKEGETTAMDYASDGKGIKLNATLIQSHFRRNR